MRKIRSDDKEDKVRKLFSQLNYAVHNHTILHTRVRAKTKAEIESCREMERKGTEGLILQT